MTDRCTVCGRFVGHYPVGFYCDTHCSRCICTRCPGFRESPWAVHQANREARIAERKVRAESANRGRSEP